MPLSVLNFCCLFCDVTIWNSFILSLVVLQSQIRPLINVWEVTDLTCLKNYLKNSVCYPNKPFIEWDNFAFVLYLNEKIQFCCPVWMLGFLTGSLGTTYIFSVLKILFLQLFNILLLNMRNINFSWSSLLSLLSVSLLVNAPWELSRSISQIVA